jgi:ferredoxin-thioredoxin reductase catalytic chain
VGVDDLLVLRTYERLAKEAESAGYHLNPDVEFAKELVRGLLINENRYGYWNCPCRLATGDLEQDRDVICPCDYRDQDLTEYGACYCALYVNDAIAKKERVAQSIPERRPLAGENQRNETGDLAKPFRKYPVWRCRVCGYLCARDDPPETCPICRAKRERFQRFQL